MSLEHDIQQRTFRNEYQKAIINILYTQNYLVDQMTEVFKQFEITRQQYNVLRILRGQHPKHASINLIKERMLEKMSDSSRIVERLRIKGLIQRADGKNDKRSVEITITGEGLDLLNKMKDPIEELENFLNHLSIDEARELNNLLDKIRPRHLPKSEKESYALELMNQPEKF